MSFVIARSPQCSYLCDDPMCDAVCQIKIKSQPKCVIIYPSNGVVSKILPTCSVRCTEIDNETDISHSCPMCETICENPVCSPNCHVLCEPIVASYYCKKPLDCPKPRCELLCERPACESDYIEDNFTNETTHTQQVTTLTLSSSTSTNRQQTVSLYLIIMMFQFILFI